jgi:hypothetical protein
MFGLVAQHFYNLSTAMLVTAMGIALYNHYGMEPILLKNVALAAEVKTQAGQIKELNARIAALESHTAPQ